MPSPPSVRRRLPRRRPPRRRLRRVQITTGVTPGPVPVVSGSVDAVIAAARSVIGVPYVFGAADPAVGFDCSGLTMWAWAHAGSHFHTRRPCSTPHSPTSIARLCSPATSSSPATVASARESSITSLSTWRRSAHRGQQSQLACRVQGHRLGRGRRSCLTGIANVDSLTPSRSGKPTDLHFHGLEIPPAADDPVCSSTARRFRNLRKSLAPHLHSRESQDDSCQGTRRDRGVLSDLSLRNCGEVVESVGPSSTGRAHGSPRPARLGLGP